MKQMLSTPDLRRGDVLHSAQAGRKIVKAKKRAMSVLLALIRSVFIVGFCFIILYPVLSMISKAFMSQSDIYDNAVLWIPKHYTLDNLKFAWSLMDYTDSFLASAVVTIVTTILQTFSCLLVGYGFARFEFRFRNALFVLVILTILVPPQQIMVPLYLYFRNFDIFGIIRLLTGQPGINCLDSYWPFAALSATCMGIRNGLFIFIFRQFFRGMPKETEEAAWVDGAGPFKTFFTIMAPNAVTAIATVVLFSFVWQWNDTYYSGMFLQNLKLLPQAYQLFQSYIGGRNLVGNLTNEALKYDLTDTKVLAQLEDAGVFLVMAPIMVLYTFTQKYFVESVERSGIVG